MATETARAIEAILMVADQPVPPQLFAQLLELQLDQVTAVLDELMASYEVEDRGFILTKVAGGYRYQSHPDQAPYVERFVLEGQSARLSAAALETLAIIAYKQPISRAQVAQVRGVNVDGVVKTLEQRGYIAEIGRDPGPGNPSLFGTTDVFLEKLGLASLADLPPIAGFVPGPDVVEQLEHGLRAEIDAETAAYVADLAERADDVAAAEAAEEAADEPGAATGDVAGDPGPDVDPAGTDATGAEPGGAVTAEPIEPVGAADALPEDEPVDGADALPEDEPVQAADAVPEDEVVEPVALVEAADALPEDPPAAADEAAPEAEDDFEDAERAAPADARAGDEVGEPVEPADPADGSAGVSDGPADPSDGPAEPSDGPADPSDGPVDDRPAGTDD